MTTKIDIASQALALIRCNPIASFDEGTNESDVITQFYDTFVADAFSRYPWSFCTRVRRLVIDKNFSDAQPFKHGFIVPEDCQTVTTLSSSMIMRPEVKFERRGGHICADFKEVWARYTTVVSEHMWPGYFTQYAIYALAALIAIPLTDKPDLMQTMHTLAYGTPGEAEQGGKFRVAVTRDSQTKPEQAFDFDQLSAARFA